MEGSYQSAASQKASVQFSGRWTSEEHEKFLEGLKMFGRDWRQIEEHIGSRTCAQIRSHAQKYFNRLNRNLQKQQGIYKKSTHYRKKKEEEKRQKAQEQ